MTLTMLTTLAQSNSGGGLLLGGGLLFVVFIVIALAASVFWIWMLIDAIQNPALDGTMRIVWVLVILFTHILGALVYFFAGRGGSGGARGFPAG